MASYFAFTIRHFLYWLLLFPVFRLVFLIYHFPFKGDPTIVEMLSGLVTGFRLDISVASYLFGVPALVIIFSPPSFSMKSGKIIRWYYLIITTLVTIIILANLVIFGYWGTLLNNRAIAFLSQPREALASVTGIQLLLYLVLLILVCGLTLLTNRKLLANHTPNTNVSVINRMVFTILAGLIVGFGLRGGWQLIPVNESSAVYSTHHSLNQMAINPVWYLMHNLHQSGITEKNPYVFMSDDESTTLANTYLKKSNNDTTSIFKNQQNPNIVIILLESWTADIIEPLKGVSGVTPFFTVLSTKGLLFTSIYSSGFRTDQGLISVLSGYPSQPNKSIIRIPTKVAQLPSLVRTFSERNYNTSFYYGGETGFANMNNYLKQSGIQHITNINDFSSDLRNSKWGVHDEYVFGKQLLDLSSNKEPFLSVLLTLSTHEPFEVPIQTPFDVGNESEMFKKSAWYTDQCLKNYFTEASKTDWYKNTIFILMADHGHRLPLLRDYNDPRVRQIPLLIIGEPLADHYRGVRITTPANQHDFPSTLLSNLNLSDSAFIWSVNITDPQRNSYVYLSLDYAITFLTEQDTVLINLPAGEVIRGKNDTTIRAAKAYLQCLYGSFISH